MQEFTASLVAPPAPIPEGEVALAVTVSAQGQFGVLTTSKPELARGHIRIAPHGNLMPFYEPQSCPAALLRFAAGQWHRTELSHLPVSSPRIALLPDGELLVASVRIPWSDRGPQRRNAHVFGPDGAHRRAFALGDDIQQIVVDDEGAIWTTHEEEGWPDAFGIVRWDVQGNRSWDSNTACSDSALNPHGGVAWAYRWQGWLIRVFERVTYEYKSPVYEVLSLAFDGDHLLLAGAVMPDGDPDELSWCKNVGGVIQRHDAARFLDPSGNPLEDWQILACYGSRIYFRDFGEGYFRVDIAEGGRHITD